MQYSRIYYSHPLAEHQEIILNKESSHYVMDVLRLKQGERFIIFNGQGGEYLATLNLKQRNQANVVIEKYIEKNIESPLKIHLVQGISRGERMDYAIQKAGELGVFEITPVITERCGVKLNFERAEKRVQHWQRVMISACEQSGRTSIPKINDPIDFLAWVRSSHGIRFICHPLISTDVFSLEQKISQLSVVIGPEGGFSHDEISAAKQFGLFGLSLGPRVLRTETATVVALTLLQQCWGDVCVSEL